MRNNEGESEVGCKFVNLTGHEINLGDMVIIPGSGKPTRILNERIRDGEVLLPVTGDLIPIYKFDSLAQIVGLPDPEEGTIFIVSPMVRKELTVQGLARPDVVSPYAVEIKTVKGKRVRCAKALAR
jgi:hypothetical protein